MISLTNPTAQIKDIEIKKLSINGLLFLGLMICLVSSDGRSQWETQESGVSADLRDVFFVDTLHGWAVGDSATIISTINGGKQWMKRFSLDTSIVFDKVQFVDQQVGFVGGNRFFYLPMRVTSEPVLLRTTDSGATWTECDIGLGIEFFIEDMDFFDHNKGWVAVNNGGGESYSDRQGILLKTENGGNTWDTLVQKQPELIGGVAFWDDIHGYSFWAPFFDNFDDTQVYFTRDGGLNWIWRGKITVELAHRVDFLSMDTLWVTGYKASRSEDSGKTRVSWNWFNPVDSGQKRFNPTDIKVLDSNNIWLVGGAYSNPSDGSARFIRTSDAGKNWNIELEIPGNFFTGLSVISNRYAWFVGGKGLILYRNLITTVGEENSESFTSLVELGQNYPNPFNSATLIDYRLPHAGIVKLKVYDLLGQELVTLVNEFKLGGSYNITFDANHLRSGVYFYRIQVDKFNSIRKMLILR